jgi:hypothetical protein
LPDEREAASIGDAHELCAELVGFCDAASTGRVARTCEQFGRILGRRRRRECSAAEKGK